jgi:ubiquitin C-terminal hydrolase
MFATDGHDRGFETLFSTAQLKECATKISGLSIFFTIRTELDLSIPFSRLALPVESKVLTNMVGLENLGATCYLNALLQVILLFIFFVCPNNFRFY